MLRLERLTEANFDDYAELTRRESNGKSGCYCAFWHQKWGSMDEWERRQREEPEKNREIIRARVQSGFHVGVVAYQESERVAWISVSPLPEVYWTWRRIPETGAESGQVAGITCINVADGHRGKGLQKEILLAFREYGRAQGWKRIEGYPFDAGAHERHGEKLRWAGFESAFVKAGFSRSGAHWLSQPEYPRSIYTMSL